MKEYFSQMVEINAELIPNQLAYQFFDQSVPWKQYYDEIIKVTNSFIRLGLKPGDRISTILPQSPAFMNIFMAAANMGLVVVPLDPRLKAAEMANLCIRTNPKLLVSIANEKTIKETAEALLKEVDIPHVYSYLGSLEVENSRPYETLLESSDLLDLEIKHPSLDDPLIIIFTSGSTGVPKGAVLTHRNTFSMAKTTVDTWKISNQDKILLNLPVSHVGGTHDLLAVQIYAGATGVIMPSFHPVEVLKVINKYKVTVMLGVPTMYRLIFQHCNIEDYDVNSLKMVILGGEPSPPELIHRIKSSFPNANVAASWGMTETAGFFTFTDLKDSTLVVSETEGKPGFGNEMKIVTTNGDLAEENEIGEIVVKGDSVIKSYLDEKHNESSFLDGWLKTGDLGFLDKENYLHFVGRLKEMFISGGYNVYPLEIEIYLNAHPSVNASCLIEVADDIWGEVGIAFVVPEEGVNLEAEDLFAYCKEGLADYKRPKEIFIRPDLPKTLVGKISKQDIRKNLEVFISV